jgi:hypothetical protein
LRKGVYLIRNDRSMKKCLGVLFIFFIVISCKKPFTPELVSDNSRYLVIEGVISGSSDSTFIRLSRTKKVDTLRTIYAETGAQLDVESDANATFNLTEIRPGIYAAAPLALDASRKYRLRIKTTDGKQYLSEFIAVKNAPSIDSVGFSAKSDGVQIYVNSHDAANATRYYRWDYQESWQFHAQYVSAYYSNGVDSLKARQVSQQVYYCYGKDSSTNVLIASTNNLTQDIIYQAPVTMLPATSEKIEKKYSILVKQYALTSDAYNFWLELQKNTEKLGSIFDVQPSQTVSNYSCITNPNELVIGYLSVGNTSVKRIFITAAQLLPSYSPQYPVACELDTAFQNPPHAGTRLIGDLIPYNSPYIPLMGLYLPPLNPFGGPTAYTYSTKLCGDCTLRGTTTQPSFWK